MFPIKSLLSRYEGGSEKLLVVVQSSRCFHQLYRGKILWTLQQRAMTSHHHYFQQQRREKHPIILLLVSMRHVWDIIILKNGNVSLGTDEKMIHENNLKAKFSWLCPFRLCNTPRISQSDHLYNAKKGKTDIVGSAMPVFL